MDANTQHITPAAGMAAHWQTALPIAAPQLEQSDSTELRQAFDQFVGETFFKQFLGAMRKMNEGSAYFNGGRAEEIFQSQLDQVLAEKMTESSASSIAEPMFELFNLRRS